MDDLPEYDEVARALLDLNEKVKEVKALLVESIDKGEYSGTISRALDILDN